MKGHLPKYICELSLSHSFILLIEILLTIHCVFYLLKAQTILSFIASVVLKPFEPLDVICCTNLPSSSGPKNIELSEYHKPNVSKEIGETLQQLKQIKRSFAESTKHFEAYETCLTKENIDMKETNDKECSNKRNDVEHVELGSLQADTNNMDNESGYMTVENKTNKKMNLQKLLMKKKE